MITHAAFPKTLLYCFIGPPPSVGILLCASKDDTVVEYALSRSMSQMLVSDYVLELPDRNILKKRIKEIFMTTEAFIK